MNSEERRQFVREHRTAILGYPRQQDGPAMSIVYYVVEDDEILVSTMAARGTGPMKRESALLSRESPIMKY